MGNFRDCQAGETKGNFINCLAGEHLGKFRYCPAGENLDIVWWEKTLSISAKKKGNLGNLKIACKQNIWENLKIVCLEKYLKSGKN